MQIKRAMGGRLWWGTVASLSPLHRSVLLTGFSAWLVLVEDSQGIDSTWRLGCLNVEVIIMAASLCTVAVLAHVQQPTCLAL